MPGRTVAGAARPAITIGADAPVTEGVLAMGSASVEALAVTTGGPRKSRSTARHVS